MTRTVSGIAWHCYYSNAWKPVEERQDAQTTAAMQYLWGARHRDDLVRRDRATTSGGLLDETRYVLMDYFSPASITNETGSVTERYCFTAFGVRSILFPNFSPSSSSECMWEFSFQGQFVDTENGLLNYGFRYLSSHLGCWLCKDLVMENGGANLFGYVANNPLNISDLFGLDEDDCCHKLARITMQGDNPTYYKCCGQQLYPVSQFGAPMVGLPSDPGFGYALGECCGDYNIGEWITPEAHLTYCCNGTKKVAMVARYVKEFDGDWDACIGYYGSGLLKDLTYKSFDLALTYLMHEIGEATRPAVGLAGDAALQALSPEEWARMVANESKCHELVCP